MNNYIYNNIFFSYRKILLQKIIEKQNIKNTKTIYRNYSNPPPPHNITKYPFMYKTYNIYIYIYICTYVYTYTQTHPHTYTRTHAYKHTNSPTHIHMHKCIQAYIVTYIHTYIQKIIYKHAQIVRK